MRDGAPLPTTNRNELFGAIIPYLPEGDIAEYGVFKGGSTTYLAGFGRRVWAYDTFEGMPADDYDPQVDSQCKPGRFTADPRDWLAQFPNVVPVKGRFADTLKHHKAPLTFAYLDCDYHASYLQCLEHVKSCLVPGGCFVVDDYTLIGAAKAVDQWLAANPGWTADPHRVLIARHEDFKYVLALASPPITRHLHLTP